MKLTPLLFTAAIFSLSTFGQFYRPIFNANQFGAVGSGTVSNITIKSGALLTNITIKLNLNLPYLTPSTTLGLDAAGNVTNVAGGGSGTPGGSDTQLQYNNGGAFGGTAGGTFSGGTNFFFSNIQLTNKFILLSTTANRIAVIGGAQNVTNNPVALTSTVMPQASGAGTLSDGSIYVTAGTNANVIGNIAANGGVFTNSLTFNGFSVATNIPGVIGITIDGQGLPVSSGVKGYFYLPYAGTIRSATMLADQSGSVIVDIWKCTYTQFDAGSTHPVAGDKITASAPPTITATTKSQDATLTGWTKTFSADDLYAFSVTTTATSITRVTLVLKVSL